MKLDNCGKVDVPQVRETGCPLTTIADLWFAGHIARIFGLALSVDGWPHRGGVDWGGSPELLEQARTFAHEYLPGFQKAIGEAAANYLNEVLPIDVTVVN